MCAWTTSSESLIKILSLPKVLALFIVLSLLYVLALSNIFKFNLIASETEIVNSANLRNTTGITDNYKLEHESYRKILHIASSGCVGSSYTAFELDKHPKVKIFHEPFNPYFTGHHRKPMHYGLINCFFLNQCNESEHFHVYRLVKAALMARSKKPMSVISKYLNDFNLSVGFKTVQFTRFDLIEEYVLSHDEYEYIANHYYILLLVRDPRGTWNSCQKFANWQESNPRKLCSKYMEMFYEMKDLVKKHSNIHVIAIYYEYMASLYPNEYRHLMYTFFDLPTNISIQTDLAGINKENEEYGNKSVKFEYAKRWLQELNFSQIEMIQNIENCSQWIETFGYKMVDRKAYETKTFNFLSKKEMQTIVNPFPMRYRL